MFGKSVFALAFVICLAASAPCFAQDAGVSGIPRGPGSAGGLNNSVNDPSGIGNAARIPGAATAKHGGARGAIRCSARFQPRVLEAGAGRETGDPARGARIPPRGSPFVRPRFAHPGKTARFKVQHLPRLLGW